MDFASRGAITLTNYILGSPLTLSSPSPHTVLNRSEAVWASRWHQRNFEKGAENDYKMALQKGVELCPSHRPQPHLACVAVGQWDASLRASRRHQVVLELFRLTP